MEKTKKRTEGREGAKEGTERKTIISQTLKYTMIYMVD